MKICPACGMAFPDESTFCFLTGDTLQPVTDPLVGQTVGGRFRVEKVLADGPWAKLYAARWRLQKRSCVLKVFKARLEGDQRTRFQEALAFARRASHSHVLEALGGGVDDDGQPWVAHPQVDAKPVGDQKLAPPVAIGVVLQVLHALGRIHDFGGRHGSLRPNNVLVSPSGHAWLCDVGLGRSLLRDPWEEDPRALDSQRYLAPELGTRERATVTGDLYAVGALAYRLLSGRPPVDAPTTRELRARLNEQQDGNAASALEGAIPAPICTWLARMLEISPGRRPANAHQASEELVAACAEASIRPAPDPGAPALPPAELDPSFARWQRFYELFVKMLGTGFPAGAPDTAKNGLHAIAGRVEKMVELGKRAMYEHGSMNDVMERARSGREGIAGQMQTLNDDGKEVRKELQPLRIAAERHGEKAQQFPAQARERHRDLVRWEGRGGFTEPYQELSQAYRSMAELIDKWFAVRSAQLACEREAQEKEERLQEIESQLGEMRQALRVHESNLAAETEACEEALAQLGREADQLELELVELASRLSAPLRSKPELGPLFRELARA
jgi:eukaryotic-like serine/threonine-protein kinase